MTQSTNPMEISKLLDRSNCRKCNEQTCLAFAAAVYKRRRQINECPLTWPEVPRRPKYYP
ncbi:MAG: (Fe-S)-binding protein [Thermodesulfobacteriota bacterium]